MAITSAEHERSALRLGSGIEGIHIRLRGERDGHASCRELVGFSVDSRVYHLRLETAMRDRLDEISGIFRRMALSARPLPGAPETQSGRAFSARVDVLDHWVE